MRPSRRHSLSAAHDRPPPPRLCRGAAAPSDRPGGVRRPVGRPMRSPFAERETEQLLAAASIETLSLSQRIALALRLRFSVLVPWREAVRRSLPVLAMPQNTAL